MREMFERCSKLNNKMGYDDFVEAAKRCFLAYMPYELGSYLRCYSYSNGLVEFRYGQEGVAVNVTSIYMNYLFGGKAFGPLVRGAARRMIRKIRLSGEPPKESFEEGLLRALLHGSYNAFGV